MQSMNESATKLNSQELLDDARAIATYIQRAFQTGLAAHEVEEGLFRKLLEIGRHALGALFALYGEGDEGEQVRLSDGRQVRRLETLHTREYQSIFGGFELKRVVYGRREGQKIDYVPFDSRFRLPQNKCSFVLQDWGQSLALEMPYAQVETTIAKILGFHQSTHTLVRSRDQLAESVSAFWEAQPVPPVEEEGQRLVCTADGKGVPMRRGAQEANTEEAPPTPGRKPGGKKMALVGGVYTVDAFVRTPEHVLEALFRKPGTPGEPSASRPPPCCKRVRASLQRDAADTTEPQVDTIFRWLAQEANTRNPAAKKPLLLLMDGQDSLWKAGEKSLPETHFRVIEILDLLHASSYVWKAADLFYSTGDPRGLGWVKKQVHRLLRGQANAVIRTLRRKGVREPLSRKSQESLEQICGYLENNVHRMAYHE